MDVRLVGGSNRYEGRVEVNYNGQWGTVCDDDWDMENAAVVCRMRSFGEALEAPGGATFGKGTGEVLMDDVDCTGSETNLGLCAHNGWYNQNCDHSEDAGVICGGG